MIKRTIITLTLGVLFSGCDITPGTVDMLERDDQGDEGLQNETLVRSDMYNLDFEPEPPFGEELEAAREAEWELTRSLRNEREEQGLSALQVPDYTQDGVGLEAHEISQRDAEERADAMIAQAEPGAYDRDELIAHIMGGEMKPRLSCSTSFTSINGRLCITTGVLNAATRRWAAARCIQYYGEDSHVCTHDEYDYLFQYSSYDASFDPYGMWIGDYVEDSWSLCGNRSITYDGDPDITDFDGECGTNGTQSRPYRCCELW